MSGRSNYGASARFPLLRTACVSALVALGACAPRTDLPTPDTRLPLAYEAAVRGGGPVAPDPSLDRWWLLFNDPQLNALVSRALTVSPDTRSALGRLREARANRDQALFRFYPQGNLGASATQQYSDVSISGLGSGAAAGLGTGGAVSGGGGFVTPSGSSRQYGAQFNPSWEIDLFGEIRAARKAADADLSTARFDYEATRISLAAQVASALFEARGLAVQLEDARENGEIAHRLAGTAARKVRAGLAATSETARLDADAAAADAEVARLTAAVENQRRQLLLLVGEGAAPSASLPVVAVIADVPRVPASTPGELLARRPDVRRAERQLASAAARVQVDKLALFPRFTLQPGLQLSRSEQSAYNYTTGLVSIGLGLQVPILDRRRLLAEIRAQTARGESAVAAYERVVQSAYSDAEQALATLKADEARTAALTTATARARFGFDAATRGYQAGLTDITSLIQAEQAWRGVRAQLTAVRTAALLDAVNTFKALGGGWEPVGSDPLRTAQR